MGPPVEPEGLPLPRRSRLRLWLQRETGRLLSPLTTCAVVATLRFACAYRIENRSALLRAYRRVAKQPGPLLICANHLTLVDSFLIGWALGGPSYYIRHYARLAWNVPERSIFAVGFLLRISAFILKCIPIARGGRRSDVAGTLAEVAYVLRRGETALIFPEGGRSRSGRVELAAAAVGVGRIFRSVPGCRVLCVYLRGRGQHSWSNFPMWGERFRAAIRTIEPKSEGGGLRASRDVARQITAALMEMERAFL